MLLYKIYVKLCPIFRRKRMRRFAAELKPSPATRILDVGGYPYDLKQYGVPAKITVLNLSQESYVDPQTSGVEFVVGAGRKMNYADQAFDIVYSNSVIEHLSTIENQALFAREVRRVGRAVWVQTPARCFFIEPHYLTPFIHYLPVGLRRKLLRYFTVWGWITRPSRQRVEEMIHEIRLLNHREMKQLFPDCHIARE